MYIIDPNKKMPLHLQLCDAIKEDIISTLTIGEKIPSIRKIADIYNLSKTTVECSYTQLRAEGYIESKPRSGYIISGSLKKINSNKTIEISMQKITKNYKYDFFPARLEKGSFPLKTWKRLFTKVVNDELDLGGYCDDYGEYGLRVQITRYLFSSRGVNCTPEQVIVCTGFMDAIELLAKTIRHKYNSFAIEHPGYHIARRAFENFGYSIEKIKIDKNGLIIKDLVQTNSKVVYVTPSHQYPTGVTMPVANRLKLLEWAKEVGGLIIEDDYDSEMSYKNRPIPSLQGLDRYDIVVYFGTFAKSLSPSLRVAYIVLPKHIMQMLKKPYDTVFPKVSLMTQKILELFLKEGYYEKHIRKMRASNRKKHDLMKKELIKKLGNTFRFESIGGGLEILINPTVAFDMEKLKTLAEKNSIKLYFAKNNCGYEWDALRMGFGGLSLIEIEEAIAVFSLIWHRSITVQ